jgi:hypothetical protein
VSVLRKALDLLRWREGSLSMGMRMGGVSMNAVLYMETIL